MIVVSAVPSMRMATSSAVSTPTAGAMKQALSQGGPDRTEPGASPVAAVMTGTGKTLNE